MDGVCLPQAADEVDTLDIVHCSFRQCVYLCMYVCIYVHVHVGVMGVWVFGGTYRVLLHVKKGKSEGLIHNSTKVFTRLYTKGDCLTRF